MTTVSYDYGLSDESFRLFYINKNILLNRTDYDNHRFLPLSWEIQRICVHDHVDTREYLSFKLMFDLS